MGGFESSKKHVVLLRNRHLEINSFSYLQFAYFLSPGLVLPHRRFYMVSSRKKGLFPRPSQMHNGQATRNVVAEGGRE